MTAYERRNQRAIDQGWSGYGQMRRARAIGYQTAAEYHRALDQRPAVTAPVEPSPFTPRRTIGGGGVVGNYDGRTGIETTMRPRAVAALARELARYRDTRRVSIWINDVSMFRGGISIGFLTQLARDHGSFRDLLLAMALEKYALRRDDVESANITVTIS